LGRLEDLLPNIVVDWAARLRGGRCDFAHEPNDTSDNRAWQL